jgi:hypothetical protein
MEITGKIKSIGQVQTYNNFQKREVVLVTEDKYPQTIMVEFTQKNVDKTQNNKVGDRVTVGINLRGKEWTNPKGETRYFNSIDAWSIASSETAQVDEDLPF